MKEKQQVQINYTVISSLEDLNSDQLRVIDKAKEAVLDAYAPYSNFKVGAAALLGNGEMILGNNQENVAYPSGLCAERVALFAANSHFPKEKVTHLAIASQGDFIDLNSILSPCGACRQVMAEVIHRQGSTFELLLLNPDGSIFVFSDATDLLPFVFSVSKHKK